jgi:recA bacterial DNA recombination protein
MAVEYGIVKKSGAWFSYNGNKLGQGRDAVKRVIKDNKELAAELEKKIMETLNAKREEARNKTINPFLPGKESTRSDSDSEEVAGDMDDDFSAEQAGDNDDLFGDDFEVDIED